MKTRLILTISTLLILLLPYSLKSQTYISDKAKVYGNWTR
ncbi:MAG: hypothetical protein BWY70_00024 [Bacteroidetes bacterium ADurb.Bin408]|nr:MAG: hypothetical protein BWY70_00024 [Bacteroidetes bacterium ADurb.Bin408]